MALLDRLRELNACQEAIDWVQANGIRTFREGWNKATEPGWMIWQLEASKLDDPAKLRTIMRAVVNAMTPAGRKRADGLTRVDDMLSHDKYLSYSHMIQMLQSLTDVQKANFVDLIRSTYATDKFFGE